MLIKKRSLLKLFNCFPSLGAMDDERSVVMMASYLEVLRGFPDEIVEAACLHFRKRSTRFPPNSAEIFDKCEALNADRIADERLNAPSIAPPVEQYSDEHREAMKARFAELLGDVLADKLRPFANGYSAEERADPACGINRVGGEHYTMRIIPGSDPGLPNVRRFYPYGYLTPAEAAAPSVRPAVQRTTPPSHLDTWARQHGGRRYEFEETVRGLVHGRKRDAAE